MESLKTEIDSFLSEFLTVVSTKVSEKFEIDQDELVEFLKELNLSEGFPKKSNVKSSTSSEKRCSHRFLRGKNSGDICGGKISVKSFSGNYCCKHIAANEKNNDTDDEPKTKKKKTKKQPKKKNESDESENESE